MNTASGITLLLLAALPAFAQQTNTPAQAGRTRSHEDREAQAMPLRCFA